MSQVILKLQGLPGEPQVEVDQEDGRVTGLDAILSALTFENGGGRLAQSMNVTAEGFETLGNYLAACRVYEAAAQLAGALGSPLNQSIILNNLGLAWKRAGDRDRSKDAYKKAVNLLEHPLQDARYEKERPPQLANVLVNLAILAHDTNDRAGKRLYAGRARRVIEGRTDPTSLRIASECRKLLD